MLFTRFRFFSSVIQETSKYSTKVLHILKELEKPNIYSSVFKEKPSNFLYDLYISHKKDNPKSFIDWNRHKSIQFAIQNLKDIIPKYDMSQTTHLLKTLTNLRIQDDELWENIRQHLNRKLSKDIDSDNIKDIVSTFYKNDKGCDKLWNTIESILLTKIFPKHDLKADAVVAVLLAFCKINKDSQQMMLALEQQILRVSVLLDGPSIARILSTYGKLKLGSDALYDELRKQVLLSAYKMDQQTLTTVLKSYILTRNTTPELLSVLEENIITKLTTFTVANITQLTQLYLSLLAGLMKEGSPRLTFVNHILLFAAREIDLVIGNSKDNHDALQKLQYYVQELGLAAQLKDRQIKKLSDIVSKSKPKQDSVRKEVKT